MERYKSAPETEEVEPSNPVIADLIRGEIAQANGAISLARFMELALYHPNHGYYMSELRRPGRSGDFLTAPEASAYFGITLARQIAECWEFLDKPDVWEIREHGAGVGGLAYDLIAGLSVGSPDAVAGLTYRLIETNPHLRAEAIRAMTEVGLAAAIVVDKPGAKREQCVGVLLANEVADAFPVHRLSLRNGHWTEWFVVNRNGQFGWMEGDPSPPASEVVDWLADERIDLPDGAIIDASPAAAEWFQRALSEIERGFALIIDYGYPARELYRQHRLQGTLRGYAGHRVTDDPFVRIGRQDLTAHVDFSAMQRAGERAGFRCAGFTTQGAFLASLGLGDVLTDLQKEPDLRAEEYLAAQSVVLRLIDPGGLGRFGVLVLSKGVDLHRPLRGFSVAPPNF